MVMMSAAITAEPCGAKVKRNWPRRLAIAGAALVLAVTAAILGGKYWLVPLVLRQQISAALRDRWDGKLVISAVSFNWRGPSYLRGVELRDAAGRKWLDAGSVKLTPRGWPGLHPVLCEVEVEDLALQGYFAGGVFLLPIKSAPTPQGENKYFDLRAITFRSMSIGITADGKAISACDGLQLTVRRDGQIHRIEMKQATSIPGDELLLSGTVEGESLEADLNIVMRHTFVRKEATAVIAALNVPYAMQADGKMDVNVGVRGALAGLPSFSTIRISGAIVMSSGCVSCAYGPVYKDFAGEIKFDGQAPSGAVAEWSASFCKGRMKGKLTANALSDGTVKYRYREDAQGVSYDELRKLLGDSQKTRKGELQYFYIANGRAGAVNETAGRGYVFLQDAYLGDVPLLVALFKVAGLLPFDALQDTDVEATFAVKGSVVTLNKARVANGVAAIDIESGGQVDIEKHYLDLYAIVAPVKQLHDVLASIPLVKLVVHLQDRLIRVRIRGDWNAAPTDLVSKESLKDIGEGTVTFLRGVVSSGGRLGKSLYKEFADEFAQ
ncbi:MAG: AsmA-like C-terminal domain-containing protein [Candidatus Sumerlaeota bacterium]|nr:AsmA-like C-terminal domain-containing protein [Candidatus Sumerlaeota bacterium]